MIQIPALGITLTPMILVAMVMIFIGSILWLGAMSQYQLSYIYPYLSINFLIITVGSELLLGEKMSLFRYVAVTLIILGLIIISKSPHSSATKPHL